MKAFRRVNEEWLLAMQDKCKQGVSRLLHARRGVNGKRFLRDSLEQWFLPAAELTLTEAYVASSGYLEEEKHMGGSMSLFHGGLTLGGARDLK